MVVRRVARLAIRLLVNRALIFRRSKIRTRNEEVFPLRFCRNLSLVKDDGSLQLHRLLVVDLVIRPLAGLLTRLVIGHRDRLLPVLRLPVIRLR